MLVTHDPHDRVLNQRDADGWLLLGETLRRLCTVDARANSRLAAALARPLRARGPRPAAVLQVGAGTGAVTRALARHLDPAHRLDVVEAKSCHARRLRRSIREHPWSARTADRVHVHHGRIQDTTLGRRYDLILSGLPMAELPPATARGIVRRYRELLAPGGEIAHYGHLTADVLRSLLPGGGAAGHRAMDRLLATADGDCRITCHTVWANLPPSRIWRQRWHTDSPRSGSC